MTEGWQEELLEAGGKAEWKKDELPGDSGRLKVFNPKSFRGATKDGRYVFIIVQFETKNLLGYDGSATVAKDGKVFIWHLTQEMAEKLFKHAETNYKE
jgi:hypothetical protein